MEEGRVINALHIDVVRKDGTLVQQRFDHLYCVNRLFQEAHIVDVNSL